MRGCFVAVAVALIASAACGGDRQRPGPPTLELGLPPGKLVTSPDTFAVSIRAQDDNGLDSVVVSFLGDVRSLSVFNEFEVADIVIFTVPAGTAVGDTLEMFGYARDLVGERTFIIDTLLVADSTPAP